MNDRKNNIKKNIDKTKPVRKPVKGNFARKNTSTGAMRKPQSSCSNTRR